MSDISETPPSRDRPRRPAIMTRAHHVNLTVRDLDAASAFYRRHFEFAASDPHDGMIVLRDPGGLDLVLEPGTPRPDGFHFGFRFSDLDELRTVQRRLEDAGVELFDSMETERMVSHKLRDPDGYHVEIYWY